MEQNTITSLIQQNKEIRFQDKLSLVWKLSVPAILAQVSEIIMQYIDAGMVGSLGAEATASIGLVSSSTWLFGGLMTACCAGFSVQVAHAIGAKEYSKARAIFRQSIIAVGIYSAFLMMIGLGISSSLPRWLQADQAIWQNASAYFRVFALFIIVRALSTLSIQMLQCSGNMKIPSIFLSLSCLLDVIFNYFLIFPTRTVTLFNQAISMPGFGLGVLGAQLGTSLSIVIAGACVFYYAVRKSEVLALHQEKGNWKLEKGVIKEAFRIGGPMAIQQSGLSLAHVVTTRIVAPLGTIAIAAHSFAITVEAVCYMPGFGISQAATTLVGQAFGARRKDLAKSFAWLTVGLGALIMVFAAVVMYFGCPYILAILTPVKEVQELGAQVLRIELLVEAFFAVSLVSSGALRGAGDTLTTGVINVGSMWLIRLTLAALLTPKIGLAGAWIAMAADNTVAGSLLMIRLKRGKWLNRMDECLVQ